MKKLLSAALVLLCGPLFGDDRSPYEAEAARQPAAPAARTMRITPRRDAKLRERLRKPLTVEFEKTPLADVVEFVARKCAVPILLDEIALDAEGIRGDEPITHASTAVEAATLLDRLLRPLNLAWLTSDDVVLVTSDVVADDLVNKEFVFYDVGRLLAHGSPPQPGHGRLVHQPRHWLEGLVVEVLDERYPETSADVMGDRILAVRARREDQERCEALLLAVAELLDTEPSDRTVRLWESARERAIRDRLERPVGFEFQAAPLASVAETLTRQLEIDVLVDEDALEEEGIPLDEPITLSVEEVRLKSALKLILEPLNLFAIVRDDALVITSVFEAQEPGSSRPDVFDLRKAVVKVELDELIDLIVRLCPPDDWSSEPYNYAFEVVPSGLLVVRHVETNREEFESAVDEVRRIVARLPDRDPKAEANAVQLLRCAVEAHVEQVEQLVRAFVDEADWDAENGGRIGVVGDQLMIRTTRANYAKITGLLAKLRPNVPASETPIQGGIGRSLNSGGNFWAVDDAAPRRSKPKKPKQSSLPNGVTVERDLVYATRGDRPMKLDLYRPEKIDGPLPVVVWVHGGGWKNGSKNRCPATWLVPHGFAVASIEYRLTDVAQWPAQMDDCRDAVRWLRSNAKEYSLDGESIGAWGSSAGGHLVALMGTLPTPDDEKVSSRVQAVCDWYGPSDLLTMPPNLAPTRATSNGAKLLGKTVIEVPELAKQVSAFHQVSKDDAPFLIVHGDKDPGVPLEQSTKLHEKLTAAGVPSTLHVVKGAGHGGKGFQTDEVRGLVREFFETNLRPSK